MCAHASLLASACVFVCVIQRLRSRCLPQSFSTLFIYFFFEINSFSELCGSLSVSPLGSSYLCIPHRGCFRRELLNQAFKVGAGDSHTSSCSLTRQALSPLSYLPYPLPPGYLKRSGSIWRIAVGIIANRRMISNCFCNSRPPSLSLSLTQSTESF